MLRAILTTLILCAPVMNSFTISNLHSLRLKGPKLLRGLKEVQSPKMSSPSESYLNSLVPQTSNIVLEKMQINNTMYKDIQSAQICTKSDIEIDTIIFNIFKVETVFFNRNSRTIYFKLKADMADLFLYENNDMHKVTNKTKIVGKGIRNFMFIPMNFDTPVDAIMYKNESI